MRSITGRVAALKWAYYHAAGIEGYTVTRDERKVWTATGALIPGAIDAYKLAQRPLFFVAPFKGGAWRWEIEALTLELERGRFTARLGSMTIEGTNGIITRTSART